MNQLKAGVALNFASTALRLGTAFFMTPYVLSCLGAVEYGTYTLVSSVIMWMILADFGISATVSRYVAEFRAKKDQKKEAVFLSNVMLLNIISGLVVFVAGIIVYWNISFLFPSLHGENLENFKVMYLISFSYTVLYFPFKVFAGIPAGHQKFIVPGLINIASAMLAVAASVLFLWWGYKAITLVIINVASGFAILAGSIFYSIKSLGTRIQWEISPEIVKIILKYSCWIFVGSIADLLYWKTGNIIIARTSGPMDVTLFSLGINFSNYFIIVSSAVAGVFFPKIVSMVALNQTNQALTRLMARVGRLQLLFIGLLMMGFIFFGQQFLTLWVGRTLGSSTYICWIIGLLVVIPLSLPLVQNLGIQIVQAKNMHNYRAVILLLIAVCNVIVGYMLSKSFGAPGLAARTALSLICGQCVAMNYFYHKKVGINIKVFFSRLLKGSLLPALILSATGALLARLIPMSSLVPFFTGIFLFTACYILCAWLFYMNDSEKSLILNTFRRFRKNT